MAKINSVNVSELIGRVVINEHGAEFRLKRVEYDMVRDMTVYWISEMPEEDHEAGVYSFKGWTFD